MVTTLSMRPVAATPRPSVAGKPESEPDLGFRAGAQHLSMDVSYVPDELGKIDLIRQHRTEQTPEGESQRVPVPRSPFGVLVGDGLFYDIHGNLSVVPFLAFYAPIEAAVVAAGSSFTVDPRGPLNSADVRRDGQRVVLDPPGIGNGTTFTLESDRVRINRPGWAQDTEIRRNGDTTVIDPRGVFNEISIQRSAGRIRVNPDSSLWDIGVRRQGNRLLIDPPGAMDSTVATLSNHTISIDPPGVGNGTDLTVERDRITIDPAGWWNSTTIDRQGDKVVVDPPGWSQRVEIRPS